MSETDQARATFTSMEHSTPADWAAIGASFLGFAEKLPDRVLAHLRLLDGDYGGFRVDRLTHSLQTATRAHRAGYYYFHHVGLDRDLREQFRGHPCFERTARFCAEYDAPAFDPAGETLPLSAFEPLVRRVFAAPKRSLLAASQAA